MQSVPFLKYNRLIKILNKTCTATVCTCLLLRSYVNIKSINNTKNVMKLTFFTISLAWFNTISAWFYVHLTNFCITLTKQEEIRFIVKLKLPFEVQDLSQLHQAFSGILANLSKFPSKYQKYIIFFKAADRGLWIYFMHLKLTCNLEFVVWKVSHSTYQRLYVYI